MLLSIAAMTFANNAVGRANLYRKAATGAGTIERLTTENTIEDQPLDWQCLLGLSTAVDGDDLCRAVQQRADEGLKITRAGSRNPLGIALSHLTAGRAALYSLATRAIAPTGDSQTNSWLNDAVRQLRLSGNQLYLPAGLLTRAWLRWATHDTIGAQSDLDEAWDIAEGTPMRLDMADIHLYRARLFFREEHYPWKSPKHDLDAAEELIRAFGYHRRDGELADAKWTIVG